MEIKCRHCNGSWNVNNLDSTAAIVLFKECRPYLTAETIKSLRSILGVGMMESKNIANHVTTEQGKCFHCGNGLSGNMEFLQTCGLCGALNLDIHNV